MNHKLSFMGVFLNSPIWSAKVFFVRLGLFCFNVSVNFYFKLFNIFYSVQLNGWMTLLNIQVQIVIRILISLNSNPKLSFFQLMDPSGIFGPSGSVDITDCRTTFYVNPLFGLQFFKCRTVFTSHLLMTYKYYPSFLRIP